MKERSLSNATYVDANFAQNGHKDSVHDSKKSSKCNIWDAKFAQNGQLKVHEGKKPSKCKICDSKFAQNGQLKVQ